MVNINSCPICGHTKFSNYIECKDYTVSKQEFKIVNCDACNFKFTNPIPNLENIGDYYKSEDYISHSNTKKGLVSNLYHFVRSFTLKKKLRLLNELVSRGTILDYGCGTGMFINTCSENGWRVFGIEPDAGAANLAKQSGCEVYKSKEELIENQSVNFDAITLWHVLEHVVDLKDTLAILSERLNEKGVLIIALPNYKSDDANYYKEYWAAFDLPRHLYHFDKTTITKLMDGFGFNLEQCKPMLFDSYYVSLLSEKYKIGKNNYFNAVKRGLISNLRGLGSKEYSSHIYIFRKK